MSLALLSRVCPEPEVGEPPPALSWASTPSILRVCVSLCWSGIAAWGSLLRSSSPIAPGRGPEKRPGPSPRVPLAEPSDTPWPYFFFQGPRPPSCTVGVSMSRVDTPTWLGARPCHPAPCGEPSKGSSLPGRGRSHTPSQEAVVSRCQRSVWALHSSRWALEGKQVPGTLTSQARGQYGLVAAEGTEPREVGTVCTGSADHTEGRCTSDVGLPGEGSRKFLRHFWCKKVVIIAWG